MIWNFETRVYVKDYDEGKIWCDSSYISDFEIEAKPRTRAELRDMVFNEYFEHLDSYGYTLSKTQRKNFKPDHTHNGKTMFYSTARALVSDRSANYCKEHYFDVVTSLMTYEPIEWEEDDLVF